MPVFRILYIIFMYTMVCPVFLLATLLEMLWQWNLKPWEESKNEFILTTHNYETGHDWGYKNPIDYLLRRNGVVVKNHDQEVMDEMFDYHIKNLEEKKAKQKRLL